MNPIGIFYHHLLTAAAREKLPLAEILDRARGMGYTCVQMDADDLKADLEGTLALLRGAGLAVNCVYAIAPRLCERDEDLAADCAAMEHYLALTRAADCAKLLAVPGSLTAAEQTRDASPYCAKRERIARVLDFAVRRGAELGITVLMEDFDNIGVPYCFARELRWFLHRVPGLRCALDTGNFLYGDEELSAVLPEILPFIADVHCKDRSLVPTGGNPLLSVAGRALYPATVGDGAVPMRETVRDVLAYGYRGAFIVEQFDSANRLTDIRRSAENLQKMLGR